jgi:hypothetical protein
MQPNHCVRATECAESEESMQAWDMYKNIRQEHWTNKAKVAMQEKADSGVMPGCAPVGYKNVGSGRYSKIVRDPKNDWVIKLLFELVAAKYSIRKAGKEASALGLVSRNGKALGPSALYLILTNPFYTGMIRYNGELIKGQHEAIIDKKLFDKVQSRLEKRNKHRLK